MSVLDESVLYFHKMKSKNGVSRKPYFAPLFSCDEEPDCPRESPIYSSAQLKVRSSLYFFTHFDVPESEQEQTCGPFSS
jgi:hypothetical protein